MYVYIQSEKSLWTAGFYKPDGKFEPESDHVAPELAADRVHWLNGGQKKLRTSVITKLDKDGNASYQLVQVPK